MESRFEIVPINLLVAEQAIELRRIHRLRLPDAVILAIAELNDAVLGTRDTKDFLPAMERVRVPSCMQASTNLRRMFKGAG